MPQFVALTSQGLGDVLADEAKQLGLKVLKKTTSQITFDSNWKGCYRANLGLRTATRVMLSILNFPAYNEEELYSNILKHDFTKYISPQQTLCIHSTVTESGAFDNSNFVNQKVKDAIVDQFRDKFGERPSVEKRDADLNVYLRIYKHQVSVSIDTSGGSLSHRGYRRNQGLAPLRENLAAGLVLMASAGQAQHIVDPMCGSGTLLIEAALMLKRQGPGALSLLNKSRESFSFQRWKTYQPEAFEESYKQYKEAELKNSEVKVTLTGYDVDPRAIEAAQENAEEAGVADIINFKQRSLSDWGEGSAESGALVVVNPPYGERVGEVRELQATYKELSHVLKHSFKGSSVWLLSGNPELSIGMKATSKHPIKNGSLDCRWLNYEIY